MPFCETYCEPDESIRQCYLRMARRSHPDKAGQGFTEAFANLASQYGKEFGENPEYTGYTCRTYKAAVHADYDRAIRTVLNSSLEMDPDFRAFLEHSLNADAGAIFDEVLWPIFQAPPKGSEMRALLWDLVQKPQVGGGGDEQQPRSKSWIWKILGIAATGYMLMMAARSGNTDVSPTLGYLGPNVSYRVDPLLLNAVAPRYGNISYVSGKQLRASEAFTPPVLVSVAAAAAASHISMDLINNQAAVRRLKTYKANVDKYKTKGQSSLGRPSVDLCAKNKTNCGVYPRYVMPQIDDIDAFVKAVNDIGIPLSYRAKMVKPSDLAPSQSEVSIKKVKAAIDYIKTHPDWKTTLPPLIISINNMVIDGHHRFFALQELKYDFLVKVLQFNQKDSYIFEAAAAAGVRMIDRTSEFSGIQVPPQTLQRQRPAKNSSLQPHASSKWEVERKILVEKHGEAYVEHCEGLARKVLDRVHAVEPAVTQDLRSIATNLKMTLVGLDFRIKTFSSVTRKIADKSKKKGVTPETIAATFDDALRFTVVSPPATHAADILAFFKALRQFNYTVNDEEIENYWGKGDDYNGINGAFHVTCPDGRDLKIELQFHTPQNLKNLEVAHPFYEIRRITTKFQQQQNAFNRSRAIFDRSEVPPGISKVGNIKTHKAPTR